MRSLTGFISQFKKYAYETSEIFLLAAKVVMSIKSELLLGKTDLKNSIDINLKKPWWDVVLLPEDEKMVLFLIEP